MKSIRKLYKKGIGPSSSHTMGPAKAGELFLAKCPNADSYTVTLYGSLAMTGKGHGTDRAIRKVFDNNVSVVFDVTTPVIHPNTMDFEAKYGTQTHKMQIFSVGGGDILVAGEVDNDEELYTETSFEQIKQRCLRENIQLWQYVINVEGAGITDYVTDMWHAMKRSLDEGLKGEGVLPGGLNVARRAKSLLIGNKNEDAQTRENRLVSCYAFAIGEQNADGGVIVTAPTCGSCGVVPSVFCYYQQQYGVSDQEIVRALLTAGVVGNLVKSNASISGAECGCQAEIGTACAMAAAGLAYLKGMSIDEIEYSAEIALEHHLGLTCDPIGGLVQIPCIERNAVAAMRAINAVSLASFLTDTRKITLDTVITAMYETGKDLADKYRETSVGGLAKLYRC